MIDGEEQAADAPRLHDLEIDALWQDGDIATSDELFVARLHQQRFADCQQHDHHTDAEPIPDEEKRGPEWAMREVPQREKSDHFATVQGGPSPGRAISNRTTASRDGASHTSAQRP